ncbi:MAG TPA: long-chain fatty acid--CoA ligase [Verrucomicrobiae bacterium]|nr:long-chain fatty acid--CoA ligase [Verrucomicrobiae bacterium]
MPSPNSIHTMMDYPLTLTALLERAGRYAANVEIVSRLPNRSLHRYTWGQLHQRALRVAECLHSIGLKKGERVATLMWNHYAHLECYFGIPAAGGVLHPLNLRLHPDEIAWIANHAQDRFLIVDDVLLPVLEKFVSKVKFERIFVVRHPGQSVQHGYADYEDWLKRASGNFKLPALSENDGASMCYTSGTTGSPKGVLYSHRSQVLHSMAQAMADSCAFSQHDVVMLASPMFHANGWGFSFTAAMVGAKYVLPGPHLDPESILELIEREGVTMTCAVPTVWLGVLQTLEKRPHWKSARDVRILCGGTAPPESLIRNLDRHGFHLIHSWGMTETSPQATASRLPPAALHLPEDEQYAFRAKQGWPVPFVDVRIRNEKGDAPCNGQTMGEIEVRGPWVAASYYNAPETRDRWTADGWFRTGDVATVDPDGCIKLVDRSKDLVKSGGEWISSVDLENTLMSHPAVREAGVVAVQHPKWQERPLAVVALKDGAQVTPGELREFLSAKFAKWQMPDDFVFVNDLPHTSTGKLLKTELRKKYADWKWE